MWAVMGLEMVARQAVRRSRPQSPSSRSTPTARPRTREELFSDLGPPVAGVPGFNDHIPSGIRMGMDGWLYVSIGDKGIPEDDP